MSLGEFLNLSNRIEVEIQTLAATLTEILTLYRRVSGLEETNRV